MKKKYLKGKRGFASMDKELATKIAGMGGKAAQASGRGHRWTREEARIAGSLPKKKYTRKGL